MARILFVHQNFPGQFRHLAPALKAAGHEVAALTMREGLSADWQGVTVHRYGTRRGSSNDCHPWIRDLETKVIRGEAAYHAGRALHANGYAPDLVIAHPGWGESLFLKDVWPSAKLGI